MLEVTPLARAELTLGNKIPGGATPHGSRKIAEVTAARFDAQPVLSRMRFETSDERYLWLNRVVAIGKGEFAAGAVSYDIFELR
ncbi:MAG: DUF3237 family protein [Gemmatimonadota bacterium]